MACFSPLHGFRSRGVNSSGKRSLVFRLSAGLYSEPVTVPCGVCVGCRVDRSRQWATRCEHEAALHDRKCFITLTYDQEHLPPGGSLVKRDWQLFMKRLRRASGLRCSFFMCGEYGETTLRPHYHACLFGVDFPDQKLYKRNKRGESLYTSELLSRLWPLGQSVVGALTFESAAYVARYIMAKRLGPGAWREYCEVDQDTGELVNMRIPEYCQASLRPAIGKRFYEEFGKDLYPQDAAVVQGKELAVPRYYNKLLERDDPALLARLKVYRKAKAKRYESEQSRERRAARKAVLEARLKLSNREIES